MKIERILVDRNGKRVRAIAEIDETKLADVVLTLAMRARNTKTGRATVLNGAMTVTVEELGVESI